MNLQGGVLTLLLKQRFQGSLTGVDTPIAQAAQGGKRSEK
jgi:hypothetical protein